MLEKFIAYLKEQVENHSIYIWGGQGQAYPTVNEEWIKSKESGTHQTNALKVYRAAVKAGYEKKLRAFDCSGLGMYWLQNITGLSKSDMNANGMKGKCELISKNSIKCGDWVFRTYKSGSQKGRAYHIGFVIDDKLNIIHAKGRAYGVVCEPFDDEYWNTYGRPSYFENEIEGNDIDMKEYIFTRVLKKGLKGEDVENLQQLLNKALNINLGIDGIFGTQTYNAVKKYQDSKNLVKDGIAGERTITALGGIWKDENAQPDIVFTRILKYTYVKGKVDYMRGDDVKALQEILNSYGYDCGKADGIFGKNTEKQVKAYQKAHKLTIDGIVGKKTVESLGYKWAEEEVDPIKELTVCTFNTKRGYSNSTKQKKIGSLINEQKCDIVGLQEITPTAVKNMKNAATPQYKECLTLSNYGTAIMYNMPIIDESIWTLPSGGERRKLHRLIFNSKVGKVSFYNTHVQFVTTSNKTITDKQIAYILSVMEDDKNPVKVLTGDFNCEPSAYKPFTDKGYTLVNTGQQFRSISGGTKGVYTIDNIIFKGNIVLKDAWTSDTIKQKLSDHDPLFARFDLR